MSLLGKIFNDVVDIASAPVKLVTKITDKTVGLPFETDLTGFVDDLKNEIKIDNE